MLRNSASGPEAGLPGQISGPEALLRNIRYSTSKEGAAARQNPARLWGPHRFLNWGPAGPSGKMRGIGRAAIPCNGSLPYVEKQMLPAQISAGF